MSRVYLALWLFISFIGMFTACSPELTSTNLTSSPETEHAAYLNTKLLGQDKNNNGVRDEIDDFILKLGPDKKLRKAYTQYAQSIQKTFLVDSEEKANAWIAEDTRNLYCFLEIEKQTIKEDPNALTGTPYQYLEEIRQETYNTGPRLLAKQKFERFLQNKHRPQITFDMNTTVDNACD